MPDSYGQTTMLVMRSTRQSTVPRIILARPAIDMLPVAASRRADRHRSDAVQPKGYAPPAPIPAIGSA